MVSLLRGAEAQSAFRTDENYNCLHPADHRAIMRPTHLVANTRLAIDLWQRVLWLRGLAMKRAAEEAARRGLLPSMVSGIRRVSQSELSEDEGSKLPAETAGHTWERLGCHGDIHADT